jgi:predicted acetyltransferase
MEGISEGIKDDIRVFVDPKNNLAEVRELWELVFSEDAPNYLDFYFEQVYKKNVVILAVRNNRIIGMLHMNPYNLVEEKTYYIVGVATHPSYRGQGIMRKMMEFAIDYANAAGVKELILLPVDERFYTPFGFRFVSKQYTTHLHLNLYAKELNKEALPKVQFIDDPATFLKEMNHLKSIQGGLTSYQKFEPLWTEDYLTQLFYEMKSEFGKIVQIEGHILLYYEDALIEIRTLFTNPTSTLIPVKNWLLHIASQKDLILHEVNQPSLSSLFTYHQSNTYDIRPYMMSYVLNSTNTSDTPPTTNPSDYYNLINPTHMIESIPTPYYFNEVI